MFCEVWADVDRMLLSTSGHPTGMDVLASVIGAFAFIVEMVAKALWVFNFGVIVCDGVR